MAMVAFAMRKYAGKIFDLNGKPRTAKHLVDDVVEMFKAWESGKTSGKLNFMFESKDARSITSGLIKVFKLKKLPKYSDISSLTDARWAMAHEYSDQVEYPLWSLKYVQDCPKEVAELIDGVVKVISDTESIKNPQLLSKVANGLANNIDLGNLLTNAYNFEKGFKNYVTSIEIVNLQNNEFEEARRYLKGHLESTIGLWTEERVRDTLKDWRLSQREIVHEPQPIYPPTPTKPQPIEPDTPFGTPARRRHLAKKIVKIEKNRMCSLLDEICMKADEEILNIISRYVR